MAIKKLLPLLVLFSVIFFETKSSDGSDEKELQQSMIKYLEKLQQEHERNKTPLTLAAARGSVDEIKLLLDDRADINEKDGTGKTALMVACNQDTVRCIMKARADVNAVDSEGKNALMLLLNLCKFRDTDEETIFKLLLRANADVTMKDFAGNSILDCVAKKWPCSDEIFELLTGAYLGDSQADQESWVARVDSAKRLSRERGKARFRPRYSTDSYGRRVLLE